MPVPIVHGNVALSNVLLPTDISLMLLTYKKTEVKADVLAGLAVPFYVRPESSKGTPLPESSRKLQGRPEDW